MPYFTTDELRALPDMDDATRFDDARLAEARDWITAIVERECETSFISKQVDDVRVSGDGCDSLRLPDPYVQSLTAVSVGGVAYDQAAVDAVFVEDGYIYTGTGTWSAGRGNVTVSYVAGYSTTPPADLKQAMLRAARNWLLTMDTWSGADSRSTSISNEYGNINLSVATPNGAPTGLPDVDATITKWARKVRVPKVR